MIGEIGAEQAADFIQISILVGGNDHAKQIRIDFFCPADGLNSIDSRAKFYVEKPTDKENLEWIGSAIEPASTTDADKTS